MGYAILINQNTKLPVDPNWTPFIRPEEFEKGNQLMASNNLPWRWEWADQITQSSNTQ
jgi:hypothetical protein